MIKKINIKKFRTLENVEIDNIGLVNEIYGSNGSGKTSLLSCIAFMVYGETLDFGTKDEMNIDNFKPSEPIECEMVVENISTNVEYTFKRVYFGSATKNTFFVNERKCTNQKEYFNTIKEAFNLKINEDKLPKINLLKALCDVYYLPNDEKNFRLLISSLLNVDTYSILFEQDKYKPLKNDYDNQGRDYDKCNQFFNQKIKSIEETIKNLNADKNSVKVSLGTNKNAILEEVEKEIDTLQKELVDLKISPIESENTKIYNDLMVEYNALNERLNSSKEKDKGKLYELKELLNAKKNEYYKYKQKNDSLVYKRRDIDMLKNSYEENIVMYEKKLEKIKATTFVEKHCPNCNHLLNEGDLKQFNIKKVEDIKDIKNKISTLEKKIETECVYPKVEDNFYKNANAIVKDIEDINVKIVDLETTPYVSQETTELNIEVNSLKEKINALIDTINTENNSYAEELLQKRNEIQNKIYEAKTIKNDLTRIASIDLQLKDNLAKKSVYELSQSLLKSFKEEELKIIQTKTNEIFGEDFTFEMVAKNKTNDSYKQVCYASINGLEHTKFNTANYLNICITMLNKIKDFIGGCTLPILFDIADNIGKSTREKIFSSLKNNQVFYTRICDEDNVSREFRIIK